MLRSWFPTVASTVALAAGSGAAAGAPQRAAVSCPVAGAPSSTGEIAGAITDVLHSRVYVDRKYVGAPPLDVAAGSRVCTDEQGEAVFDLARSGKTTLCIILPNTTLQARSPRSWPAINFETGTAWCSFKLADRSIGAPSTLVRLTARTIRTKTIAGVAVNARGTTVKVWSGSVLVTAGTPSQRKPLDQKHQVRINRAGRFASVAGLSLTAEERIAIAKLRVARP